MLKTNVVKHWYKRTLKSPTGSIAIETVQAESEAAAALLRPPERDWELVEVTPL